MRISMLRSGCVKMRGRLSQKQPKLLSDIPANTYVVTDLQVSATGADAFSRRKTQSKVYWSTIPKNKREELQAAAAAAGTTVQINEDGTALVMTAATGPPPVPVNSLQRNSAFFLTPFCSL